MSHYNRDERLQAILNKTMDAVDQNRDIQNTGIMTQQDKPDLMAEVEEKEQEREKMREKAEELIRQTREKRQHLLLRDRPVSDKKPSWNISRKLEEPKPSPLARGKEYAARVLSRDHKIKSKPTVHFARVPGPYAQPKPTPKPQLKVAPRRTQRELLDEASTAAWKNPLLRTSSVSGSDGGSNSRLDWYKYPYGEPERIPHFITVPRPSYLREASDAIASLPASSTVSASYSQYDHGNYSPRAWLSRLTRASFRPYEQNLIRADILAQNLPLRSSQKHPMSLAKNPSQIQSRPRVTELSMAGPSATIKAVDATLTSIAARPSDKNRKLNTLMKPLVTLPIRKTVTLNPKAKSKSRASSLLKNSKQDKEALTATYWAEPAPRIENFINEAAAEGNLQAQVSVIEIDSDGDSMMAVRDTAVESLSSVSSRSYTIFNSVSKRTLAAQETPAKMFPELQKTLTEICVNLYALSLDMEHPSQHMIDQEAYRKGLALIRAPDHPLRKEDLDRFPPVQPKPNPSQTYFYGFPCYTKSGTLVDSNTSIQSRVYPSPGPNNDFRMTVKKEDIWALDELPSNSKGNHHSRTKQT